jgi:hypothetical protein
LKDQGNIIKSWQLAYARYFADSRSRLMLRLSNTSDRNYTEVQVEVRVAGGLRIYDPADVESPGGKPPSPPEPFGTRRSRYDLTSSLLPDAIMPNFRIDNRMTKPLIKSYAIRSSNTSVVYDLGRIRPEQSVDMPQMLLATAEQHSSTVDLGWKAATANVDGVVRGTLQLLIGEPIDAAEFLPELIEVRDED